MIVVVGSINRDLIVTTETLPVAGETVLASRHIESPGGKGANQAVAASRLGAEVAFVGRVGEDDSARMLVAALADDGVDISAIARTGAAATGLAVITVEEAGENTIVVSAGANALLSIADVTGAGPLLRAASVTLLQLEIPVPTVTEAAGVAGGLVMLNAAPARPLPETLLSTLDVLVVNRSELETLTGDSDPAAAAQIPVPSTVVTVGAEGAVVVTGDAITVFPAPAVDVVDTTGAGDAFCGALAAAFDAGMEMDDAVSRAVVAGALATTALGARSAMPTTEGLEATLRTLGS
ncbi:MAG: ribokinase [Acidimicrobiia bacterium]|nr:MAG: ribokinase [Acidimicrobiia bacterium]